jgi:hypothetical protein
MEMAELRVRALKKYYKKRAGAENDKGQLVITFHRDVEENINANPRCTTDEQDATSAIEIELVQDVANEIPDGCLTSDDSITTVSGDASFVFEIDEKLKHDGSGVYMLDTQKDDLLYDLNPFCVDIESMGKLACRFADVLDDKSFDSFHIIGERDNKADGHQYAPRNTRRWSFFFNRRADDTVAPNARFSSEVGIEDSNNIKTEEDWWGTGSPMLTSSSEETYDSDWSDDLENVEIELSTEEMSTSSKGTVGWFHKHHILKSKRKHAEARLIFTSDKENSKQRPKRKNIAKYERTLKGESVWKETAKAKVKRKSSSKRSLWSIIKGGHKAKGHRNTATKRRHHDTRSLCRVLGDDVVDSMFFLQYLGEGVKEESLKYLPWKSGNDSKISSDEASTKKSEEHAYYLNRSKTAASF